MRLKIKQSLGRFEYVARPSSLSFNSRGGCRLLFVAFYLSLSPLHRSFLRAPPLPLFILVSVFPVSCLQSRFPHTQQYKSLGHFLHFPSLASLFFLFCVFFCLLFLFFSSFSILLLLVLVFLSLELYTGPGHCESARQCIRQMSSILLLAHSEWYNIFLFFFFLTHTHILAQVKSLWPVHRRNTLQGKWPMMPFSFILAPVCLSFFFLPLLLLSFSFTCACLACFSFTFTLFSLSLFFSLLFKWAAWRELRS